MIWLALERTTSLMAEEITMYSRKYLFSGAVPDPEAIRPPAIADKVVSV